MRENYLTYRDTIFINRRLIKTRFGRSLLLFCAINSKGKSVICGFSMLSKEDEDGYTFATTQFSKAFAGEEPPRVFVVERSATLRAAIQKVFAIPGKGPLTVLYCTEHFRRSIRHFFDAAKNS